MSNEIVINYDERAWPTHTRPAIRRNVIVLDATWSDIPKSVNDDIRRLWVSRELGNDYYYYQWDWEMEDDFPYIGRYLRDKGLNNPDPANRGQKILIHWWW